jgi:hypothetical protein
METATPHPNPAIRSSRRSPWLLIAAALALVAGVWQAISFSLSPSPAQSVQQISAAQLESDYGVRIRLIGVTAAGGMLDVRFKILDPVKAAQIFSNQEMLPRLIAGNTVLVTRPPDLDSLALEKDGIVFMLFPNRGGAVRPGTPVTITFGDLRLEPIAAQ